MDRIDVLELDENGIDDACLKNRYIIQCQNEYLAFVDSSKISGDSIVKLIQDNDLLSYGKVLVFAAGEAQDAVQLSLESVIECFALQMVAMVFPKELLSRSGNYNYRLRGMTDFELLCRLVQVNGTALFIFPGIQEDVLNLQAEDAYTSAYMVRKYIKDFQSWGKMGPVLKNLCMAMEQCGVLGEFKRDLNAFLGDEKVYNHVAIATAPIVILRGDDTCFGVLQNFADSLAIAFRQMGQACILAGDGKTDYEYIMNHVNKAIVGFQTKAFKIDFFRNLQGPKFQFWFDNPIVYEFHFIDLPDDCNVLCHDANYVEFISEQYQHKNTVLLPPAGHYTQAAVGSDRPFDIVFIGKYIPESGEQFVGVDKELYEYMLDNPTITFAEGIKNVLERNGLSDLEWKLNGTFGKIKEIYQDVISHYREKVIETILKAGYEVHVYGESWNMYQSPNAHRLVRHPAVTVEESIKEWQKAKIGLNVMSWHKAGMTERIANIMLSGAVCLSEETSYLKENFAEGEQIVTFKLNQLEELPGKIEQLLKDDSWQRIAHNGYESASREHTWEKRASQLLEIIEEII